MAANVRRDAGHLLRHGSRGTLIAAFEAETGIRVTYINMAGGPLQARIYAEEPRPRWAIAPIEWAGLGTVAAGIGLVSPVMSGTAYPILAAMFAAAGGSDDGRALLQRLDTGRLSVAATNPLLSGNSRAAISGWPCCRAKPPIRWPIASRRSG